MGWFSRVFLLVAAVFFGGSVMLLLMVIESGLEPVRHAATPSIWWIVGGAVVSCPLWLPAIIPDRLRIVSRIVRWICALIMACPAWIFGTVVLHQVRRWLKGAGASPFTDFGFFLVSVSCTAAIAILIWPDVRLWLRKSNNVSDDGYVRTPRPRWEKALTGLIVLFFGVIVIAAIGVGYSIYDENTSSEVWIRNWSGSDVRFEKVTIDDQSIWGKPHIVIKTIKNLEKPWLDTRGDSIAPKFRAPKMSVELKLVVLNEMQERETVACTLDNRPRPCRFDAYYLKGRLVCRNSLSNDPIPARGTNGEFDRRVNWPPEWPDGPYPQPIK